jgi:hypothetical protein
MQVVPTVDIDKTAALQPCIASNSRSRPIIHFEYMFRNPMLDLKERLWKIFTMS